MHVIVWQFQVHAGREQDFETAYGPAGVWTRFFQQAAGYRGTQLLRDRKVAGRYLTIDRWASEDAYRSFRKENDAAYEALDRTCDALTSRETRIGTYTV